MAKRDPPPPEPDDQTVAIREPQTPTPPAPVAVVQWLISGASEHDVLEALRARYPDADPQATMAAVADHLAAEGQPNGHALRGWALVCYRELYRRMLEVGDFDGARKVLKNITEIGL